MDIRQWLVVKFPDEVKVKLRYQHYRVIPHRKWPTWTEFYWSLNQVSHWPFSLYNFYLTATGCVCMRERKGERGWGVMIGKGRMSDCSINGQDDFLDVAIRVRKLINDKNLEHQLFCSPPHLRSPLPPPSTSTTTPTQSWPEDALYNFCPTSHPLTRKPLTLCSLTMYDTDTYYNTL